jgi:hypothetical protein
MTTRRKTFHLLTTRITADVLSRSFSNFQRRLAVILDAGGSHAERVELYPKSAVLISTNIVHVKLKGKGKVVPVVN